MKPTLEQIKTDESVWPDGATHYTQGEFQKWVGGYEYSWSTKTREWVAESPSWDLEKYEKNGYKTIHRPTKAFVPEVGEECEFNHPTFGWTGCTIIGPFRSAIVCAPNGGGFYQGLPSDYRKIKTEREEFMERVVYETLNMCSEQLRERIANELYDAGCRFDLTKKDGE